MKIIRLAAVLMTALLLTGCGKTSEKIPSQTTAAAAPVIHDEALSPDNNQETAALKYTTPRYGQTEPAIVPPPTYPPITEPFVEIPPAVTEVSETETQAPDESAWMTQLVNQSHLIGEYQPPELVTLSNGTQVDARMYPDLQAMYDAMREAGLSPYTREGYRTYADQQEIMNTRIAENIEEGYSEEDAKAEAEKYVALPGTSEHQLGLAVDINSTDGESWGVYEWLAKHAYEYGFILRYPEGKEDITGYEYEPWHYRYVGKKVAEDIHNSGLTLEEYLS